MKINMFSMLKSIRSNELLFVRLLLCICFLGPMFATSNLWFGIREFPLVPLFNWIPIVSAPYDVLFVIVLSILFGVFVFKPKPIIGVSIVLLFIYLASVDQNRLQPFFFELIFAVLAMTLFSNNKKSVYQCLLLIFIGTYFWSGIHKANSHFFEKWMLGMNSRIPFVPEIFRQLFTYAIPVLEASFGLLLVFKITRKYGVILITIMHTIIVSTLLIEGFGYVVIPMTLFNVITLLLLYYNSDLNYKDLFELKHRKSVVVFLIAILFPLFNFFGFYDHLLSFSYFSGKPKYCRIWLTDSSDIDKLPSHIKKYMHEWEGAYYTDLNNWSQETLGVGVYPEMRVYISIEQGLQQILGNENSTKLDLY